MRLAGKIALVTGAGVGFGAGTAKLFTAEGAKLVVADINPDAAQAVAAELGAVAIQGDVSQRRAP